MITPECSGTNQQEKMEAGVGIEPAYTDLQNTKSDTEENPP
jgi:hypothetical protein